MLANPYAPIHVQEFYFVDPPQLSQPAAPVTGGPVAGFDVEAIRRDFPILAERVNGHQLVWLDNAATTQKPQAVIDRLAHFYDHENSNIHRAAHELAARATDAYEDARGSVASFLGAPRATKSSSCAARPKRSTSSRKAGAGRTSAPATRSCCPHLEHHANIVPWQMLAENAARPCA